MRSSCLAKPLYWSEAAEPIGGKKKCIFATKNIQNHPSQLLLVEATYFPTARRFSCCRWFRSQLFALTFTFVLLWTLAWHFCPCSPPLFSLLPSVAVWLLEIRDRLVSAASSGIAARLLPFVCTSILSCGGVHRCSSSLLDCFSPFWGHAILQFIAGPCASIWGFATLLKGTLVLWRCSGTYLYYQNQGLNESPTAWSTVESHLPRLKSREITWFNTNAEEIVKQPKNTTHSKDLDLEECLQDKGMMVAMGLFLK